MNSQSHWDRVYQSKPFAEVSWFESASTVSLDLIYDIAPHGGRIIDIGGGTSFLVDRLVAAGNWEVTALDVSAAAIQ